MKGIIRIGDKTTGEGEVLSGSITMKFGGIGVAREGDPVDCPIPGHGRTEISEEDEIRITAKKKIILNAGGSYITLDPFSIESGTEGDYIVKSASYEYVVGAAKQVAQMPQLPPVTEYDAESLRATVFSG